LGVEGAALGKKPAVLDMYVIIWDVESPRKEMLPGRGGIWSARYVEKRNGIADFVSLEPLG